MIDQEPATMSLTLRLATPTDAPELGRICHDAFGAIADQHNFPRDFPSVEAAQSLLGYLTGHPGIYGVVAESDGRIVGSNFMDERSIIAGIGPITVDPVGQNRGVGRALMGAMLDRVSSQKFPGVRLVQAGYHVRSLSLYASLGFVVREPLALMHGEPLGLTIPGRTVRPATDDDLESCNQVCRRVHGHDRGGEVHEAIHNGTATVVELAGRITGYATSVAFFGHAVGETDGDLKALIGAAPVLERPGLLVPARSPLFRWGLEQRLRVVQLMTLMTVGLYNEPAGAYLPSILY